MTLRNLQVFVKVAESGKMNIAAKQLFVSQSSVSQAISEIEREYGVLLFDRIGKHLYITPLGKELLEYAKKAISYHDSVCEWLSQSSKKLRIRIGVTITIGSTILSSLVSMLEKKSPSIDVFSFIGNTESVEEKLLNGSLDIGLVEGDITNPYINSKVVIDDHLVLVCGRNHRFFGRTSVHINELENEKLLLREHGSGTRAQLVEKLDEHNINYHVVWESYSSAAIKQGVIDGHGISVLSERLVEDEVENGQIWTCRIDELPMTRHFSLAVYTNRVETEAMHLFSKVVEEFSEIETEDSAGLIDFQTELSADNSI